MGGELECLGEQLGENDPTDHQQDDQRVAVVGQAARLRHEPPEERPADRHEHDHGDRVLHDADEGPDQAVERDREDLLDDAAGDDVGRADRQQHEAPEDACMHQPGAPVLEHLGLDERVLHQTDEAARDVGERARSLRTGRGEHAKVARHRQHEDGHRAPEQGEDERVVRDLGEWREQGHRSRLPAGAAVSWSNGPARVSSAWSRTGSIAASDSIAPLGLPGRFTTSARPMTPTTPRDRSASGVDRRPAARMASARPGTS